MQVRDSANTTATRPLSITISAPALTVTTTSLASGTVGTSYSQTLSASGGVGGNTWTVTSGSLPDGLTLAPAGTIAGTPTTAVTANFTVQVRDSANTTAATSLSITISAPALTVTTTSLANGTVGTAYSQTLNATGGAGGNTWTVTSGSLPDGLTLAPAGTIAGTPTTAGTANFTVQVRDSANTLATKSLSITIGAAALTVTTTSLPGGTAGTPYSQTLSASGGAGGNTWTVTSGSLPDGLTLAPAGTIAGTPTTAVTANFTVQVRDSANTTAATSLSIAISAPALTVTTTSLANGTVGTAYSQTLNATGGVGGNTWTVTSGSLPDGLTLAPAGTIGGTPTTAGTANFTVQVRDSANTTATRPLSITIGGPALTVATTTLANGTTGTAYSQTLNATGGAGGNTWSITSGSLPDGLTLAPGGTISGTPSTAGTSNFTVQVKDSANTTATSPMSITIRAPALTVTTTSLANGTVGTAYSQSLAASGGAGGNAWSITAGSLPDGVTLAPSGAISGTPTTAGTANFTVQVKDSANTTATKPFSIAINAPALTVTTTALANGMVGIVYSQALAASGGAGANVWSVTAGSLPSGLTLAPAGTISGTPTTAGTANFTVQVKDSANTTAGKALSITINPAAYTVTTTSLANGTVGTAYSQTLTASGGAGGNTWSIAAGALPDGVSLAAGGTISGTPTTAGTGNFTVQVKDSANTTAVRQLSITIAAASLTITTSSLPAAPQGAAYSQNLTASGGNGGYRWSLSAGALPAGLVLDQSGRISGTATGGSSSFTVQVTDSGGAVATKALAITVTTGPAFQSPASLPGGVNGMAYSTTIAVNGGRAPYTIAVASGQLPPGLSLNANSGEISGRPTQAGSFPFTLQVRDASGAQTQAAFTIVITNGLTITNPPILPGASLSIPYQASLQAEGGTAPYAWSVTAGTLPAGLTFHTDGKIDGTPSAAGSFTFTASVTDGNSARSSKDFTLPVAAGLSITTAPQLPPAVPGGPYTATLAAAGGTAPYLWSIAAGGLPAGVSLNASTGVLAGTPTSAGTYNFTAAVTDAVKLTVQKAFTLTVAAGLTFTTPAGLPDALAGTPYSFTLRASGGQTPYSWRIADGALPGGLSLNATSGLISGTPADSGTFNFTIEVADPSGLKGSLVHTIVSNLPSLPSLAVAGVPTTLTALQQPSLDLAFAAPYPVAVTGRLNLTFIPATGMPDDPAVQFSSGGRSATFTIPANDTHATFSVPRLALQSGSVAGTLQFTVESLRAGTVSLPAPVGPLQASQVVPGAAFIRSVAVARTSGGFDVQVVALSTTREVTAATVRFRAAAGSTVPASEVTVPLTEAARAWFQGAGSMQYGGQFTLNLPFSIVGTGVSLESVVVILTNSVGPSAEVSAPY